MGQGMDGKMSGQLDGGTDRWRITWTETLRDGSTVG